MPLAAGFTSAQGGMSLVGVILAGSLGSLAWSRALVLRRQDLWGGADAGFRQALWPLDHRVAGQLSTMRPTGSIGTAGPPC